jgi:hypothetical protein
MASDSPGWCSMVSYGISGFCSQGVSLAFWIRSWATLNPELNGSNRIRSAPNFVMNVIPIC